METSPITWERCGRWSLIIATVCCRSFAQSCLTLRFHRLRRAMLSCPSLSAGVCSNSCQLSWWCHPTISPSITPFSSYHQSFPASGSFLMSRPFASGGQSIGASVSVLPMNVQGWFPLGLIGLVLQSKGLSTAPQFESINSSAQPSLWSNSYIHTWLVEKP